MIVGPNAAGKTNLLRAFSLLKAAASPFGRGSSFEYYHLGATEFELKFEVSLSEVETSAIGDFLTCLPFAENIQVPQGQDPNIAQQQAFQIASQLREPLARAFRSISLILRGRGRERGTPELSIAFGEGGSVFESNQYGTIRRIGEERRSGPVIQFARFLLDSLVDADPHREAGDQFFSMLSAALNERYIALQVPSISSLSNLESNPKTEPAVRNLRSFLRSRNQFADTIGIGSIVLALFNASIAEVSERRLRPSGFTSLPTDSTAEAASRFDSMTSNLALGLFQLKNGLDQADRVKYLSIKDAFRRILGEGYDFDVVLRSRYETEAGVEISPPSLTYSGVVGNSRVTAIREVAVFVNDGKGWVHLDFAAAGLYELLAILSVIEGEPGKILLLDEPALNLHPIKQLEVRRTLERSLADSKNQVILLTHSPFMVSTGDRRAVMRFFRGGLGTEVVIVRDGTERTGPGEQHGGAVSAVDWASALFAAGLVIVEGPSDKYVVEHLDQSLPSGTPRLLDDDWVAIASHGKKGIPAMIDLARKLKMPFVVLTDADTIMECSTKVDGHPVPLIFRHLMGSGVIQDPDASLLKNFETVSNGETRCYKREDFPGIRALARKYQIYALPGTLEDVLGLAPEGRRKFRDVLELVDSEYGSKPIPEEIKSFFEFANSTKEANSHSSSHPRH